MSVYYSKSKDIFERAAFTAVQSGIAALVALNIGVDGFEVLSGDSLAAVAAAAVGAFLSAVKGGIATRFGSGTASAAD